MMVVYLLNEIGTSQWQCTSFHTDMLVIMKESTVLAKSLVHINFLEKLCFFFHYYVSLSFSLSYPNLLLGRNSLNLHKRTFRKEPDVISAP